MGKRIPLTSEEKITLENFAARYDKTAKGWRTMRFVLLGMTVYLTIMGLREVKYCWDTLSSKESIIDRLKEKETDFEGLTPELWAVAEVRRAAAIFEAQLDIHSLALIGGVIGILLLFGAALGYVKLWFHWNDAKHELVLAKILRHVLNEWTDIEETKGTAVLMNEKE
jgi:hypothetical protein